MWKLSKMKLPAQSTGGGGAKVKVKPHMRGSPDVKPRIVPTDISPQLKLQQCSRV